MKNWNKIIIDRSNKIKKIYKPKNYKDFSNEMGGYDFSEYYKNKESFFTFYFTKRYLIWQKYLEKNLKPSEKTLSIASGRGINELTLISKNFNIACSDLEIPNCYEHSKKLFGNFNYFKLNILTDTVNDNFNNIYSISACYIFSNQELEIFFTNVKKMLNKDGILILDFGGGENNLTSFFFNDVYLILETYFIFFLSKIFNKKIGFKFDSNFGYRRSNKEIINFASKMGFEFISLDEYDYLTEVQRSILIRKVIEFFPPSKYFFSLFGRLIPYVRMFKFKQKI